MEINLITLGIWMFLIFCLGTDVGFHFGKKEMHKFLKNLDLIKKLK